MDRATEIDLTSDRSEDDVEVIDLSFSLDAQLNARGSKVVKSEPLKNKAVQIKQEQIKQEQIDAVITVPLVPVQTTVENELLSRRWKTRGEAVTALKLHSTKMGHRIKTLRKSSGSKATTLICCTHDQQGQDKRFACDYRITLRRSKSKNPSIMKKPWTIKQGTQCSDLQHCDHCLSRPKISFKEAVVLTKPTGKSSRSANTIKSTAKNIAMSNKIPLPAVPSSVGTYI